MFKTNFQLFLLRIIAVLAISSCLVNCESSSDLTLNKSEEAKMNELVAKIAKDPVYKKLEPLLIKRLIRELDIARNGLREKQTLQFKQLTNNTYPSKEDENRFAYELGFEDRSEYLAYRNLYVAVLKYHKINELSTINQQYIRKGLDELLMKNIQTDENLKALFFKKPKSIPNARISTGGYWGLCPESEVMKCAFDYRNCTQGYTYGDFSIMITYTTKQTTSSQAIMSYIYTYDPSGVQGIALFSYHTISLVTNTSIDYTIEIQMRTVNVPSSTGCDFYYRNCINSCVGIY